jgi:hypothetical protein
MIPVFDFWGKMSTILTRTPPLTGLNGGPFGTVEGYCAWKQYWNRCYALRKVISERMGVWISMDIDISHY